MSRAERKLGTVITPRDLRLIIGEEAQSMTCDLRDLSYTCHPDLERPRNELKIAEALLRGIENKVNHLRWAINELGED